MEKVKETTTDTVTRSISANYAQKKASLWESGQLVPTHVEMQVMSELLGVELKELEESFSGIVPAAAPDLIRSLAGSPGQSLIASCFTGRVRRPLQDVEDAFA